MATSGNPLHDTLVRGSAEASGTFLASLIITTYNRCDALPATLDALANQTVPQTSYEILIVDDGSPDATQEVLAGLKLPPQTRLLQQAGNQGISAGRNLAISHARGEILIFISDDLIVPADFVETHLQSHVDFPNSWVVGGFSQLPSIRETPFGRYLDSLENGFDEGRKSKELAPGVWELALPTARNLSMPRADLARTGLFDEQFRTSCEDVDLANRAREAGIRFIYNDRIRSLHNDQVGDLGRYLRAQVPRTRDTVLYYVKHQEFYRTHGDPPVARANAAPSKHDPAAVRLRKRAKAALAQPHVTGGLEMVTKAAERMRLPDPWLWRLYQVLIGIYMYRGWTQGVRLCRDRSIETSR